MAIGGATIKDLFNQSNYYSILNLHTVILQCGIVDCTPRAFGRLELEIIKKIRLFRFTKPLVKTLRRYRAHRYTSPKKFKKYLLDLREKLNAQNFYALSILPSNPEYEVKAPSITRNIETYNNILKSNVDYIDLSSIPRQGILEDHHHINEIGHNYIFKKLVEVIDARK